MSIRSFFKDLAKKVTWLADHTDPVPAKEYQVSIEIEETTNNEETEMASLNAIKDALANAFGIVKKDNGDTPLPYSESVITERFPELSEIVGSVSGALEDGFQWEDLSTLSDVVEPLMRLAGTIKELTGEQKQAFVVDAVYLTYRTIDGWPDGKSNNINLPVLFGSMERKVEERVVKMAAAWALRALYKRMRADNAV